MSDLVPFVSVVIPCRNEEGWIGRCLESLLCTTYRHDRLEIIVVDGMSDDGTRAEVERRAAVHSQVRLLENPARITPAALNIGIAGARGDIILRVDAHNVYPDSYITALVYWLMRSGADNVGGVWHTVPGGPGPTAAGIAIALAHPAGVGNARFRIGAREPTWVDTVPFGCYRREVFERIGPFDEDLIRNQDDEFNIRLIRAGGRILLVPEIVSTYHARDSLGKLWRMYYQYGYFKPLVARKVGGVFTWRQLVPPTFVLCLVAALASAMFSRAMVPVSLSLLAAYLIAVLAISIPVAVRQGPRVAASFCAAICVLHFSYGLGFLEGVVDFLILRRRTARGAPGAVPISR